MNECPRVRWVREEGRASIGSLKFNLRARYVSDFGRLSTGALRLKLTVRWVRDGGRISMTLQDRVSCNSEEGR